MLKHSETIINSNVRRQDGTWDYRWDFYNSDNPNTIFERPDMTAEGNFGNDTWYFCGDASELRKYDSSTWDPEHPVFEYKVSNHEPPDGPGTGPNEVTDEWDNEHQYNPTRYLSPGDNKFIRISNTVQNVTIDTVPPAFISDYGTEYIALQGEFDSEDKVIEGITYSKYTRDIQIQFKDDVGLDYKQVALYIGDTMPDWGNVTELTDNIIYYYDRKLNKSLSQPWVDKISFNSNKDGTYLVKFALNECWGEKSTDEDGNTIYVNTHSITDLSSNGGPGINTEETEYEIVKDGEKITKKKYSKSNLNLIVWDLAGNYSIYKIVRPFNTLKISDLNNLVPVIITFKDIEPSNYYLEDGIEGKIVTQVYDPNDILWEFENVAKLMETSIGAIDLGSYEAGDNRIPPLTGIREFIITHLTESGNVEVEAWVETGIKEIDGFIKENTYNTAICGPWIYGDEGRKYHITPYVPKYLHGTEFADFIEFFQLYINTLYKGLETNRNISALEKIARIGNFNDIARLENSLVYHYANQFGNEFDFNVEALQNVNLINNGTGFTTKDMNETFDTIKYVLEELPAYNRYKGTNTGIEMAIKMFGFVCQIINVWVRKENEIEKDPEFIEENRLYSFEDYFMTSRFDIELGGENNTFKTFCDNIDMFIDLIKSIKPITKILNLIKYSIRLNQTVNIVYDIDELEDTNANDLEYELTWKFDKTTPKELKNIQQLCTLDKFTGTADLFCLSYLPTEAHCMMNGAEISMPSMVYNIIGKLFKSNYKEIILSLRTKYRDTTKPSITTTYNLNKEGLTPILNAGSFFLNFTNATNGTNGYNMIKKFFDFNSILNGDMNVTVKMKFKLQNGTDYAESLIPSWET